MHPQPPPPTFQVRDWYVESFKDLRAFTPIKDSSDEVQFTDLLKHIYNRHKVWDCVWRVLACAAFQALYNMYNMDMSS